MVNSPPTNAGDIRVVGSIPGLGRSPGGGHGNPLQYSCWRIPWTEEPGSLQSMGLQRVGHDWIDLACRHVSHLRIPQLHTISTFPPISILLMRKSRLRETASLGRIFERLSRGAGERKEQIPSSMNLYIHEFIQSLHCTCLISLTPHDNSVRRTPS